MITVAIIGILASIALPSYSSYVARARRADARAQLTQAAQYMQRFYSANDSYLQDRAGTPATNVMPEQLKKSPADGTAIYQLNSAIAAAGNYTATLSVTAYTLSMAPVSGGPAASDPCGIFTLTSTGVRGVTSATKSRDECWK
jgi:type IV pilus assembly protein PilE